MEKKIVVIDANAPWVRSLFGAMKQDVQVCALNVHNALTGNRPGFRQWLGWERSSEGLLQKPVLVPGWTKFPGWSLRIVLRAVKKCIRRLGGVDLIVYTLPYYAGVAEFFKGKYQQAYLAHDVFRFYDWDVNKTFKLEKQMLDACDGVFSVAQALSEDFRKMAATPVFECPMAVSSSFVEKLSAAGGTMPDDVKALKRPIVGCVGQINRSYDWPIIGAMANAVPEATFVFIGPIFSEPEDLQRPMRDVLARPNVKWLGPRPHAELPSYLRGFDICLNPLAITEHNDRRSPLRLYDYLATDRPILSTGIREAFTHGELIPTFKTSEEGIALLRQMISREIPVDVVARSEYLKRNTWEARAKDFLAANEQLRAKRRAR